MKNKEAELEKRCVELVLRVGGKHRKMDVGPGSKGQFDQHVWLPNGVQFDVEFKIGEERLSKLQQERLTWFMMHGYSYVVYVVYEIDQFQSILRHCGIGEVEK